jgi:hypothetical protein
MQGAKRRGLLELWSRLWLGRPSRRVTAYPTAQRAVAVLAHLAAGLQGIAPGNLWLRPNSEVQHLAGGRFPDQGTIHRWLDGVHPEQVALWREHLQDVVRTHGQFWKRLRSAERLVVDVDAQGMAARGAKFTDAAVGYLGEGIDRGYQRVVSYVGETHEVLDELVCPGNTTLMSVLPRMLEGLNRVFTEDWRERVIVRTDSHGGTAANLQALQTAKYHYLSRMQSYWAVKRLRREVSTRPLQTFAQTSSTAAPVEFWDLPTWTFRGRGKLQVPTRAIVFHETRADQTDFWWVLLTDLSTESAEELWTLYHQRGGTIEEYNDQSERAFHLRQLRTSHLPGLCVMQALVGLCWNLIQWETADLQLPEALDNRSPPAASNEPLITDSTTPANPPRPKPQRDLQHLLERASHCGLSLSRHPQSSLAVTDTIHTRESRAWLNWLKRAAQIQLLLSS